MHQLGRARLEHDPARDQPGGGEGHPRQRPPAPQRRDRQRQRHRGREERQPQQRQIGARRRAVLLLSRGDLGHQIVADRLHPERPARADSDRHETRQHRDHQPDAPRQRPQRQQPPRPPVHQRQRRHRGAHHQRPHRPFQQHRRRQPAPEQHQRPAPRLGKAATRKARVARRTVEPGQRSLRHQDRGQQRRIGRCQMRLGGRQEHPRQHQPGRQPGPRPTKHRTDPRRQQHRQQHRRQRRKPVFPDFSIARRPHRLQHDGLHPVDADRLLIARAVLKADVDHVARGHHLLGRLREPGLVPIHRGQAGKGGQRRAKRQDQQQDRHRGPRQARQRAVDQAHQSVHRPLPSPFYLPRPPAARKGQRGCAASITASASSTVSTKDSRRRSASAMVPASTSARKFTTRCQ